MKKLCGLGLTLVLLCLPAASAHAAMSKAEAAEKAIGLIEKMADIIHKDMNDCDKMAADLNKFLDDNAALIKELNGMKDQVTEAERKEQQQKYATRIKAATEKMQAGGQKCGSNEKVRAAFERLGK